MSDEPWKFFGNTGIGYDIMAYMDYMDPNVHC